MEITANQRSTACCLRIFATSLFSSFLARGLACLRFDSVSVGMRFEQLPSAYFDARRREHACSCSASI
jgi:hypothetical protein